MLFDQITRTDEGAKAESCPEFTYWNLSARPDLQAVREELECWYRRYPEQASLDLRNSFRSKDDSKHRAAFFELFLHEALVTEFDTVQTHPDAGTKGKRPDFLVAGLGERFFVEAVSTSELSADEKSSEKRKKIVREAVDNACSEDFWIAMTIIQESGRSPSGREVACFLNDWLGTLDAERELLRRDETPESAVPACVWRSRGCAIKFEAYATRDKGSTKGVAVHVDPIRELHHRERLLAALRRKASRYGAFDAPFLIALDIDSMTVSDIQFREALYGQEFVQVSPDGIDSCGRWPNGLWHDSVGPINRRISGVVFVQNLKWWTLTTAPSTLYPNPWAKYPYRGRLERLRRLDVSSEPVVMVEGQPLGSVIAAPGIVPSW